MIEGISAVTLGTHQMRRAVRFYRALGFEVLYGGEESSFTSLRAGTSYLNLIAQPAERRGTGGDEQYQNFVHVRPLVAVDGA